jgi:hypothetical protein
LQENSSGEKLQDYVVLRKVYVMKNMLLNKVWFVVGSSFLLACSCSSEKGSPKEKGPQQEPFEHPAGMDSEGEEGASSNVMQSVIGVPAVADSTEKLEEKQSDTAIFVTPILVEAVKREASEPASLVQESSAKEASSVLETVSAPTESSPSVQ